MMQWCHHESIILNSLSGLAKVDVYLCNSNQLERSIVVLAERYDNAGFSITNAFKLYAKQVCNKYNINDEEALFFELCKMQALSSQLKGDITLDQVFIHPEKSKSIGHRFKRQIIESIKLQCVIPNAFYYEEKKRAFG